MIEKRRDSLLFVIVSYWEKYLFVNVLILFFREFKEKNLEKVLKSNILVESEILEFLKFFKNNVKDELRFNLDLKLKVKERFFFLYESCKDILVKNVFRRDDELYKLNFFDKVKIKDFVSIVIFKELNDFINSLKE